MRDLKRVETGSTREDWSSSKPPSATVLNRVGSSDEPSMHSHGWSELSAWISVAISCTGLPPMPWIHVAPISILSPPNSDVFILPPTRVPPSTTTTSNGAVAVAAAGERQVWSLLAAVRPAIPAPMITILGFFATIIIEREREEKKRERKQSKTE